MSGVYWRRESSSAARSSAEGASGSSGSSTRRKRSHRAEQSCEHVPCLERFEESNCVLRDAYSGRLKLYGKEHERTLIAANNYANSLVGIDRFEEAKSLLRETVPVTQRVLGANHDFTLRMRSSCSAAAATMTRAPHSTISARPRRRSRTLNGSRGACLVARTRCGGYGAVHMRVARAALRARERNRET